MKDRIFLCQLKQKNASLNAVLSKTEDTLPNSISHYLNEQYYKQRQCECACAHVNVSHHLYMFATQSVTECVFFGYS